MAGKAGLLPLSNALTDQIISFIEPCFDLIAVTDAGIAKLDTVKDANLDFSICHHSLKGVRHSMEVTFVLIQIRPIWIELADQFPEWIHFELILSPNETDAVSSRI